jgi:hypothetical protein
MHKKKNQYARPKVFLQNVNVSYIVKRFVIFFLHKHASHGCVVETRKYLFVFL